MKQFLILFSIIIFSSTLFSQNGTAKPFGTIDERKIVETKWKYTYTIHKESNTIIHQARGDYKFFIHFRYDYTYDQFLNGDMTHGVWSISGDEIFYQFKHINKFRIKKLNKQVLVLEFSQPNSNGLYQYHFVKVSSEEAPFIKPPNELPDILVETERIRKVKKKSWWSWFQRDKKSDKEKSDEVSYEKQEYINIELIGGGFYGGIDPVLKDFIHIKSSGRLIKEFKSVHKGLIVKKVQIPREELEEFAQYIVKNNFFSLDRVYDCETEICNKRKQIKPRPIPLRLGIAIGSQKRTITITVWGIDKYNVQYVEYPTELEYIISAIHKMASRPATEN